MIVLKPLTLGLKSNTEAEIEAQTSPVNEAPRISTILAEYRDLPINPSKCNYVAIRWVPPLQLFLATGSPGDCMQVVNLIKDLAVIMEMPSHPPPIA